MTDATPLASEQITQDADELEALIGKATEYDLADEGRYFSETCNDLTSCRHGETGEYNDQHDGRLVEFLWNHRHDYLARLRASATPAPSDQDASQAQGEVERLAQDAERLAAESTSRIDAAELRGFATGLRRAAALSPAPGATAQDGVERCSFCNKPATTSVADDSDTFDCCDNCEAEWQRDPGFVRDQRATPTISAGMVAWNGGDSAPNDWDGGPVLLRNGETEAPTGDGLDWRHFGTDVHDGHSDIIAYTPLAAAPKKAEQQGVEAFKAMRADDVKTAVRAWLDADDATHWGAFEVALDAAVEGVSERDAVVAMLQADAETMRQNAAAYSEEAPTDARALHEVATTLAFKAAQIKRGDHLAALNAPTGAVEKGEAK